MFEPSNQTRALASNPRSVVIGVVGDHANETLRDILDRKIRDVRSCGKTFWVVKSWQAPPDSIQRLGKKFHDVPVYFVNGGAKPTKSASLLKEFSSDNREWSTLPNGIGPVSGRGSSHALVLSELEWVGDEEQLDLWQFANFENPSAAIKTYRGGSTVCAIRKEIRTGMVSRWRRLIAKGRLKSPYAVWMR